MMAPHMRPTIEGSARLPRAYTPNHLVQKILNSRSALVGERKQVTVFFVDVKESMHLAERVDAEEWHRIMDRFFAILADGIHRFEGTINQFTGDGVMALFGAPIAHEDHAQRACHAALYLREQLRLYAQQLKRLHGMNFAVRMGLNSGEVIVGKIGDDVRMDYTAQGHTVGLAARMQQSAVAGGIYLPSQTAALVSRFFELAPVGRIRVKGARQPVRTFALVGVGALRTRLDVSRARGFSRFVGRADEVATLEGVLSRAMSGFGQVVGVAGAAGVGKSRLCQEVVDRWRAEGLIIAEAHCQAQGKSLPYGALLDLLHSFFGSSADEGAAAKRRRVRSRLRRLSRGLEAELQLVLEFLGTPDPARPQPAADPGPRREQLFALVRRLVQAQSAAEPAVLLIDDLDWIDPESDAFMAELVEAVGATRTLLLLNFRPEYSAAWMSRTPSYQTLQLAPLAAAASDALLRELVGDDPALGNVCAAIKERAEGNPFFIEEIVESLPWRSRRSRTSVVRVADSVSELRIPATVQSLLAARIDRLPEQAKLVLQAAAVIGKRFSEPVLRLALEMERTAGEQSPAAPPARDNRDTDTELASALRILQHVDLIHLQPAATQVEYAFRHTLTQEVAYHSQLQETRARKHAAVAQALEVVHASRVNEYAALLAHHWEAANQPSRARQWRQRAAAGAVG